jgi:eukaryotic-like serine/threonine-protein kinase
VTTPPENMVTLVETAALQPGVRVSGKFRVTRFVGAGGMAQVFEAINEDLDERVALKLMHPALRADRMLTERFRAEARAAARIRSENVARVFDVVSTDSGDPVIVMEFLEGQDLRDWAHERGPVAIDIAVGIMVEACAGLAVAHANGIVHRDVKPENLFIAEELGSRTVVKLLDFGISRAAIGYDPARPGSGQHAATRLLGTPTYMAPEQINSSRAADCRIDVWGVGVLLFELLTGVTPFAGDSPEATCLAVLNGHKRDLRVLRPDVPDDLATVIDRCLKTNPQARFPSVADLAVALRPFARIQDHVSVDRAVKLLRSAGLSDAAPPSPANDVDDEGARRSVVTPAPFAPLVPSTHPTPAPTPGASPGPVAGTSYSRKRWVLGATMLLGVVAGALLLFAMRREPSSETTAPTSFRATVLTQPLGARVDIDGRPAGRGPVEVTLPGGSHLVEVSLDGYLSEKHTLAVASSGDNILDVTLERAEAAPTVAVHASSNTPVSGPAAGKKPMDASPRRASPPVQIDPFPEASTSAGTARSAATVRVITDGPSSVKVIQ